MDLNEAIPYETYIKKKNHIVVIDVYRCKEAKLACYLPFKSNTASANYVQTAAFRCYYKNSLTNVDQKFPSIQ